MLSIETREDWSFVVTVQIGAAVDTWSNTSTSAHAAIEAFCVWASAAARPWPDSVAFSWVWQRDVATGGALLSVSSSVASTLTVPATGVARLGIPTGAGTVHTGIQAASGTWAPGPAGMLGVVRDFPFSADTGDASATGAVRSGVPALFGRAPAISAIGDGLDNARLVSVLRLASNPRRAMVYQLHRDEWVEVALGGYQRSAAGLKNFRYTFDASGEVL
jgi:hypothetical protein